MQNAKKDFLPKFYLAEQNFPHLEELQIFVQMERNTLFPILKAWNRSAFSNQGRIFT